MRLKEILSISRLKLFSQGRKRRLAKEKRDRKSRQYIAPKSQLGAPTRKAGPPDHQ